MMHSVKGLILALLAGLCLVQPGLIQGEEPNAEARKATTDWLALVDSAKFEDSWTQASSLFKEQVTEEKWVEAITNLSGRAGKLTSRKLRGAQATKTLPRMPDGDYAVFIYDSAYENFPQAVDSLVLMKDKDGSWRVSAYSVRPAESLKR